MHIDYCRIEGGNFGDDLNLTLWQQLFPDIDHLNPDVVVAGIGTILSRKPSANIKKVILGAGAQIITPASSPEVGSRPIQPAPGR